MTLLNFEKTPPEKQRSIINAGFLCFGQNGYQKTSAADIAKAAGISKASLFHYFGSKKKRVSLEVWTFLLLERFSRSRHQAAGIRHQFRNRKVSGLYPADY